MAEYRPLLIFPTPKKAQRDPGGGGGAKPHAPGRQAQAQKLGPKFDALQTAFEAQRLEFQQDPQGLAPEFVLVIETRGRIEDFQRAAQAIGMDWLGEIDQEDLEPDEDFYTLGKNGQQSDKKLDGRWYLAMTNQQAMEELLSLWRRYINNEPLAYGKTLWRDLFDYAKDIRRWGAKDRLRYSGILDEWSDSLKYDPQAKLFFRLELWYRDGEAGLAEERVLREWIQQNGGQITAASRIDGILFHGLKGHIPVVFAQSALHFKETDDEFSLPALFRRQSIKHFQPVAQGVSTLPQETEPFDAIMPPPDELPPVLALLDGYPLARHDLLNDYLTIHDPDDVLSRYDPREMRHGTAMASLILNGELDAGDVPLSRKIYCRPVLEPDLASRQYHGAAQNEHIPETAFAEDRIHRAVVEMFEGDTPIAPTVCIVNLSIGEQPFDREISPWARLIDWLAWKYNLLFCISAGNHSDGLQLGINDTNFSQRSPDEQIRTTLAHLGQTQFKRKLLSPGEAINALTVGAQHSDQSTINNHGYYDHRIDLLPLPQFPSPISALGPGFRRAIKPEILMPGGRQLYQYKIGSGGDYQIAVAELAPGQRVAAPDRTGTAQTNQTVYTRGTSNATALASRAAARFYEVLEELKAGAGGASINRDTTAPLLKALLAHGATWPDTAVTAIENAVPHGNRQKKRTIAKFLGYGVADPARVESCTAQRATVLGCGLLKQDEAHEYHLPLPIELSGTSEWRRLIITLAWLSPINPKNRAYRKAKLSFSPPTKIPLKLDRQHADWQQAQKGTVQHEVLESEKVSLFQEGDNLRIKVSAQGDSGQDFDEAVPYGLVVTLEVREQSTVPVYERIRDRIREKLEERISIG